MQHGPSIYGILFILALFAGLTWLGVRLLPKWHPVYAGKPVRYGYWLATILSIGILFCSRWLRTAGSLAGEGVRYASYAAYVWLFGLLFMLVVLLAGYAVRLLVRKFSRPQTGHLATEPAAGGVPVPGRLTRRQFLQGAVAVVPAVPLAVTAYGVIGGDTNIVVNRYTLAFPQLLPALDGYVIAQISDTHIGSFFGMDKLDRVLAMVKQEKPQLLTLTGDLVDDLDLLSPTMARLTAFHSELSHGIFYCWGNHEYFRDIGRIRQALYASPVTVLENRSQAIGNGLYLAGVDYPWGRNKAEQEAKRRDFFAQAVRTIPAEAFTVLLAHHPDFLDNAFAANVPLALAGHTHGGQVSVFGVSLLPVQYRYMRGLFRQHGSYGYVSAGTGHWMPLRIGCPAEVSLFTLQRGGS
ncbi:metallophosphoesterase [Sporomusa termitida]|uniref:3',5'-cyclic adenosine monophosphate phosphodieSPTERase CpdA n=1 Tax=Sporomusa termitida TaxID=2377 RepID=A0A517E0P2_9FIRM|nr:metallophosphoesterase [Sporomusa termitida]QDR83175.1 3',5'-cyclic adenosine monophosphate phosphodieSPTERase CpdA [Sporomusa termitida]